LVHIQEVNEYTNANVFALEWTFHVASLCGKFQDLRIYAFFDKDFSAICKSNIELFLGGMYKTNLHRVQKSSKIIY